MAEITVKDKKYSSKKPEDILLIQVMDGFNLLSNKLPLIFSQINNVLPKNPSGNTEENKVTKESSPGNLEVLKLIPLLISEGIFYEVAALLFLDDNDNYISSENVKWTKSLAVVEALRDFFTGIGKQWSVIEPLFKEAQAKIPTPSRTDS